MEAFLVSVIIPVYNCEQFIEKAIQSALMQPEVFEVIVVNDGSTDGSEAIIKQLQAQHPKIKLYYHPNKINKGRSATRNLGVQSAIGNYIAFLDADDFYLEYRFKEDYIHFVNNPTSDGVYNAIGVHFYRDAAFEEREKLKLTTVTDVIKPQALFETLLYYKKGHFSIDGLTVKKTIFEKVGNFDETLKVSEDTHLIYKMALKCKLHTGIITKPVAVRGVHNYNVFNNVSLYQDHKLTLYESLIFWGSINDIGNDKIDHLLNVLWLAKFKQTTSLIAYLKYWFFVFGKHPSLLLTKLSIKYFPLVRLRKKLFSFLYK